MASGLNITQAGGSSISGIRQVDRALSKLERRVNKKIMKKAMRKTVAMFRKEVRKRTPKGKTGNLRKSTTTSVKVIRKNFIFGKFFFGRTKGKKGWHAHFLEYGTSSRIVKDYRGLKAAGYRIRAKRMPVGSVKAVHMGERGFDIGEPKAKRIFQRALTAELRKLRAVN